MAYELNGEIATIERSDDVGADIMTVLGLGAKVVDCPHGAVGHITPVTCNTDDCIIRSIGVMEANYTGPANTAPFTIGAQWVRLFNIREYQANSELGVDGFVLGELIGGGGYRAAERYWLKDCWATNFKDGAGINVIAGSLGNIDTVRCLSNKKGLKYGTTIDSGSSIISGTCELRNNTEEGLYQEDVGYSVKSAGTVNAQVNGGYGIVLGGTKNQISCFVEGNTLGGVYFGPDSGGNIVLPVHLQLSNPYVDDSYIVDGVYGANMIIGNTIGNQPQLNLEGINRATFRGPICGTAAITDLDTGTGINYNGGYLIGNGFIRRTPNGDVNDQMPSFAKMREFQPGLRLGNYFEFTLQNDGVTGSITLVGEDATVLFDSPIVVPPRSSWRIAGRFTESNYTLYILMKTSLD